MNREEIYNKIIDVSEKYGDRNPQQLKQLHFVLEKQNPDEVFNGLYRVFLREDGERFTQQQLAGVLLYKIRPKPGGVGGEAL